MRRMKFIGVSCCCRMSLRGGFVFAFVGECFKCKARGDRLGKEPCRWDRIDGVVSCVDVEDAPFFIRLYR